MSVLALRGLCKNFGVTEIIRGVDLNIEAGEKHAIIGPNGAGKSTLFHLISGKYAPSAGSILFKDQPIENLSPHRINRLGIARSFQVTNIFPRLSVFENIRCALLWSSGYGYSFWRLLDRQRELNENTEQVLHKIGLTDKAWWFHETRDVGDDEYAKVADGYLSDAGISLLSRNHLLIIAIEEFGWFFVNDRLVAKLDLGHNLDSGNVSAMGGFFANHQGSPSFENFNVWVP